jgi:hypothetical protein
MTALMYPLAMADARIRNIPEMLWREFKAVCALEGTTINDKIIELIQKTVEQHREGKLK